MRADLDINILDYQQRLLNKVHMKLNNQKILDIGCGDGGYCEVFSGDAKMTVGVDVKPHPNWRMTEKDNIYFVLADACNLPFPDHAFDMVFAKDVLHHVPNHKRALDEMKRIIKVNGTAIIMEANRYNPLLYFHMTLMKDHQHFSKKYFKSLITSAFKNATFMSTESHVYPTKSKSILKLIHFIEDFLGKIPLLNNYLSYNIAVCRFVGKRDK